MSLNKIQVQDLGLQKYALILQKMQEFTKNRDDSTLDEIWFVEHNPVFTLGQAGKKEHILNAKDIPIIQTDRGGQVTYHGPGQIVIYFLIDLKRRKLNIREMVTLLEHSIIDYLKTYNISAVSKKDAPGVYVDGKKICSIGLRVSRSKSYHGLAFNVDMDLTPFTYINPCGYEGLEVTQLKELNHNIDFETVKKELLNIFKNF